MMKNLSMPVLEELDLLAEAGLCAGTFEGSREYLKDIRGIIKSFGIQGGLTKAESRANAVMRFKERNKNEKD